MNAYEHYDTHQAELTHSWLKDLIDPFQHKYNTTNNNHDNSPWTLIDSLVDKTKKKKKEELFYRYRRNRSFTHKCYYHLSFSSLPF